MPNKIDFGQELFELNGEPVRLNTLFHSDTVGIVLGLIRQHGAKELYDDVVKLMNEHANKPLLLTHVVTSALISAYEKETLDSSERITRNEMARRFNKAGMLRIKDAEIKKIMNLIEKKFNGSLISPQVEALLNGKEYTLFIDDTEAVEGSE